MSFSTLKNRLCSVLAEEFETCIPQFKPYTSDYQMVIYACKDLEVWLKAKWEIYDQKQLFAKLEEYLTKEPRDFKVFVSFWVSQWLEKWRVRVKVSSTQPKTPNENIERREKARKLYMELEHRKELKKIIVRKLLCQNEICMIDLIAENLIIEEISKRTENCINREKPAKLIFLNPVDILGALSCKITKLAKEKGHFVYLNMKPYLP